MELHPRLSVSALSSWRQTFDEDLSMWRDLGIRRVGVWAEKVDAGGWPRASAALLDAGVRVGNVIAAGPFTLDRPSAWEEEREELRGLVAAADVLDAPVVAITPGPAGALSWEAAAEALAAALAPTIAQTTRVLALEHTNSLRTDISFVHTLADAVDLARRAGCGVLLECNACWAERGLARTIAAGVDVIGLVQVDDVISGTRTTPARVVPGDGDIPLNKIVRDLIAAGYSGDFDLEVVGPAIEEEGYASAIRRSVEAMNRILEASGA